ncbi:MAG: diadenylate cyclase [Planctomycetota bacterium]|nr:diadenylate cyclase [Planctomycetota bacterium]
MTQRHPSSAQQVILDTAVTVAKQSHADAVLILTDQNIDWTRLTSGLNGLPLLIATDKQNLGPFPDDDTVHCIMLEEGITPNQEKLAQAMIEAVADEHLNPRAKVVALYSGFETDTLDSVSVILLGERLDRLTGRDLQQLDTKVPLKTLRSVVDIAVEIAREGREGKPVGTLFAVGDSRKVLGLSHPLGMDPVKGYRRKDRNIRDPRVREDVKEFAQTDGAIVIETDGTVAGARRYLDASSEGVNLVKGLGARHWAAAAISNMTRAIAIAVSQSTGNVRIFQKGQSKLRITPTRHIMKWQDFESVSTSSDNPS